MIRLPQKHIADSVLERILAAEQRMNPVQKQGQQLEAALLQQPGEMEALPGMEDAIVSRSLGL